MRDEMREIPVTMMVRIHNALSEARDNAAELESDYINKFGGSTKKNRAIIEVYARDVRECEDLIRWTSEHGGVPF